MKTLQIETLPKSRHTFRITGYRWPVLALLLLSGFGAIRANTLSWSGGSAASANWNDSANWGFAGTPANGDTLVFSSGQPQLNNSNNIAGLTLAQIRFAGAAGGYTISGNSFSITGGIYATNSTGVNVIGNDITLSTINQPVVVGSGASLMLAGVLSGTVGLTKSGDGTLTYSGNVGNYYSGPTAVTAGTLELGKPYDVGIGNGSLSVTTATVRELYDYQLGSIPVTIAVGGLLDLNGFYDTIGYSLTLSGGGSVQTGAGGTLAMESPSSTITSSGSGSINGSGTLNLNDGPCSIVCNGDLDIYPSIACSGGTITKSGAASLRLRSANTFSGPLVVAAGLVWAYDSLSLGTAAGGTVVNNSASLVLNGNFGVTNEPLTLNGVGVNSSWGALDAETQGTNIWTGPITLNANSPIAAYGSGTCLRLLGAIGGAGGLLVGPGSGILYLEAGTTNTYSGPTTINSGTLVVNSYQPQSPVNVASANSVLRGSGTVGIITSTSSGLVVPGGSPGILTCSNVVFSDTASTFSVELNGTAPGTGYDQLNVRGTCSLGSSTLTVSVGGSFSPVEGQPLVIVNNDGSEAVTGTFNGLAQGALLSVGNYSFIVSYAGSSGNDVTLTLTNQFLKPGAALVSGGNGNGAIEVSECNLLSLVVSNLSGSALTGASATLRSLTPGVAVVQPFSGYPDIPAGQRGTNKVAFQVMTLPAFVCGASVNLELEVATATHGTLKVPFTLPSGAEGSPLRFNNNASTNIPDIGTIESTNTVAGFSGPLLKVAVSLWLTHTYDADLNISLISPAGVVVDLSSGNGAGGNFGSACSPDASRTTFDDGAVTAISAGLPPYAGPFRPEGSLAALIGGTANGNWRLRVQDTGGGTLGTLRCWSLFLSPIECTPAGGVCELCPEVTIKSYTGSSTPLQNGYFAADGFPSTCGVAKACPTVSGGSFPGESFTFHNGPSDACITVTVSHQDPSKAMVAAAYLGSFDPAAAKCVNYLADAGTFINYATPSRAFSFNVASNATFVLNVVTDNGGLPYTLAVSGGDCRPVLNLTPASATQMKLDWTTAAAGYQLEHVNNVGPGVPAVWPAVTDPPVVVAGRFTVTNTMPPTNNFFRLRKLQ